MIINSRTFHMTRFLNGTATMKVALNKKLDKYRSLRHF